MSSEPGLTRLLPICSPAQSIVSKNALQYRGNAQHDAQEFLLWLLDRVHEDLHHAVKQGGPPPVKVRAPRAPATRALHPVNTVMLARLRASAGFMGAGVPPCFLPGDMRRRLQGARCIQREGHVCTRAEP